MNLDWMARGARRTMPRIGVEALCTEIVHGGRERHAIVANVSAEGLRLVRPFFSGPTLRTVQLEFELPGIDEIMWAKGHVCFDQIRRGPGGLVRTTGIQLAAAAARDLRLVRDYVMDAVGRADDMEDCALLPHASRYALG
jgi:hypothetical protein